MIRKETVRQIQLKHFVISIHPLHDKRWKTGPGHIKTYDVDRDRLWMLPSIIRGIIGHRGKWHVLNQNHHIDNPTDEGHLDFKLINVEYPNKDPWHAFSLYTGHYSKENHKSWEIQYEFLNYWYLHANGIAIPDSPAAEVGFLENYQHPPRYHAEPGAKDRIGWE